MLCWPIRLPCVIYGSNARSTFVDSELKLWPRAESPVVVYRKIVNGRRISVIYIYTATSANWWWAEVKNRAFGVEHVKHPANFQSGFCSLWSEWRLVNVRRRGWFLRHLKQLSVFTKNIGSLNRSLPIEKCCFRVQFPVPFTPTVLLMVQTNRVFLRCLQNTDWKGVQPVLLNHGSKIFEAWN